MLIYCLASKRVPLGMCYMSALQFSCLLVDLEKKEGSFLFEYGGCKLKRRVTTLRFMSSRRFRWHQDILTLSPPPRKTLTLAFCSSSHHPIPHPTFPPAFLGTDSNPFPRLSGSFTSFLTNPHQSHLPMKLPKYFLNTRSRYK